MQWLWAGYQMMDDPPDPGMTQDEFTEGFVENIGVYEEAYMALDVNHNLKAQPAPVALVYASNDGWNIEPHVEFLPWATLHNKVRVVVGFIMMKRYDNQIGCIRLRVDGRHQRFYHRLRDYIPIRFLGKIEGGRSDGHEFMFYVRGKRKWVA